jgi:hypothetical protein
VIDVTGTDVGGGGTAAGLGLCATCRHARRVASARGSVFSLCARSADDPRFAKYPRLPVLRCAGFEPREARSGETERD